MGSRRLGRERALQQPHEPRAQAGDLARKAQDQAAATGVEREPAAASRLRESVSRGDWAQVPALFAELGIPRESSVGRAARFVAYREAYLEVRQRQRRR